MQFKLVSLALTALVACASAASGNNTYPGNRTTVHPGGPTSNVTTPSGTGAPTAPSSGAFSNAISGGLLGVAVAAGLSIVM